MSFSNAPEGWQPEDPNIISYGEYKLGNAYAIYLGQPVAVDTTLGTAGKDENDGNKIWLKPYDAVDGSDKCVGVSITNRLARGSVYQYRLGLGGYRRDLRLLQWGIVPMLHADPNPGTPDTAGFKDKLAPYPGGFIKYPGTGDALGYLWQYESESNQISLVFVMPC